MQCGEIRPHRERARRRARGCFAQRATVRCACRWLRIGLPASTAAVGGDVEPRHYRRAILGRDGRHQITAKGRDIAITLAGLRQWGDKYLSEKPPRITRRKSDKRPVIAAFVPDGAKVLRADELESVPGPGFGVR